jgi:hypothetical protein
LRTLRKPFAFFAVKKLMRHSHKIVDFSGAKIEKYAETKTLFFKALFNSA